MNERITELAVQAGVTFDWDPGTFGPEVYFDRQEDFEKFAESIINELANIDFKREIGLSGNYDFEISQLIRSHFGKSK